MKQIVWLKFLKKQYFKTTSVTNIKIYVDNWANVSQALLRSESNCWFFLFVLRLVVAWGRHKFKSTLIEIDRRIGLRFIALIYMGYVTRKKNPNSDWQR